MSLIREALKKAGNGKEPEILRPDKEGKKKKPKSFSSIQSGALVVVLLGLAGVLMYLFLPGMQPFQKTQGPPAPSVVVKDLEKKSQKIEAVKGMEPLPPPKMETKAVPPIPLKESKEKELVQQSERFFKAPPARMVSPRPTAKPQVKTSLPPKLETTARPTGEVLEPTPAPATSEGIDSLPLVRLFNEAVRNQQKGLYAQAIQGYQEILARRPAHWETYNNLGLIYQNQKLYTLSLEMFQKALSLNPRYLKGYNNLGLLYLNLGKLEEANNQFRQAIDLDPEFIPAYINLAVGYKRQGKMDQARKCLQKALEHDTESLEAHYNLGLLWEQEGAESKALEHYQKFVSRAQGPYGDLANELRRRWPGLK